MKIRNIDDLCNLITATMGIDVDLSDGDLNSSITIPHPIRRLHERFGKLWADCDHPLMAERNGTLEGLFSFDNYLTDPKAYQKDEFGVVTFWSENQGVFNHGFVENDEFAYADQDWRAPNLTVWDLPSPPSPPDQRYTCWGRTPLTIEQVLIDVLLGEFLTMFGTYDPIQAPAPMPSDGYMIWDSGLWPKYKFWTDETFSFLTNGVSVLKRPLKKSLGSH